MIHWLNHVLGLDNPSGPWELFWSGFGSDIGEASLFVPVWVLVRKHQCHYPRCWRIGRYKAEGTPWVLCHKHHPDGRPTAAQIDALGDKT